MTAPPSGIPDVDALDGVPSPEATGGAGGTFEARLGAIALARLLRGDRLPGLGLPPTRVRLQQAVAGAVLDDVVADGLELGGTTRTIEYQSKRRLAPAPSNEDFVEIVEHVLTSLGEDDAGPNAYAIKEGRRRFGVVARPSSPLADLARVTVLARSHDSAAGFRGVVLRGSNAGVRQRYQQLRDTIIAILTPPDDGVPAPVPSDTDVDEATWQVARALHVWQVDAEPDGVDVLSAHDRLQDLLPAGADPAGAFRLLLDLAQAWAPQAGSVDLDMLRAQLERDGLALEAAPSRRVAFEQLREASAEQLGQPAQLGHRLTLPRLALRELVRDALDEHSVVLLAGRAGVGKSVLGRLVARDLAAADDAVLAVNLTGRTGGLAPLEADLGVRLADAFAGAPIGARRLLLVDGAEQVLTDAGALLTAILDALPTSSGSAPPWQLLLTARDEAASQVAERAAGVFGATANVVSVADLLDVEVAEILAEFPVLDPVGRNPRACALLLRRPYLVDLLIRAVERAGLPDSVVGEEDLLDMVVARLVRRDDGALPGRGLPDARSDVFIALADAAIAGVLPARLDGQDAEARAGLRSDDVITPVRLSWQFSHDVLLDFACATRLLEPDGADQLAHAPAPRRLLRAVRLRAQGLLNEALRGAGPSQLWGQLISESETIAGIDGPRWLDVPWEALLHAGPNRQVLQEMCLVLLAEDGAGLLRLIDVAERLGRRQFGAPAVPVALDLALSGPAVDLLARLGARVPEPVRPRALGLVHAHLRAWRAGGAPDAGLEDVHLLPDAVREWLGDTEHGEVLEWAIGSLAMLGPHLSDECERWLVDRGQRHPHDLAEAVESPLASGGLARSRPDLLLRLSGLYYLGVGLTLDGQAEDEGIRPGSGRFGSSPYDLDDGLDDEVAGVRDHDPRHAGHLSMFPLGNNQANPALGPFAALLQSDPDRGLRLVGAVVDAATGGPDALHGWIVATGEQDADSLLTLDMSACSRTFAGPDSAWMWHRRTTVGPRSAQSALMALRAWAANRLSQGTPLLTVRDKILCAGTSLALPAVALSVLIDCIDKVDEELDPFLEHPLVWHLETARRVLESSGTALALPDSTRLSWTMSEVAMHLVLRGNDERRQRLSELATRLHVNVGELSGTDAPLLTQRWASELDVSHYRAEPHPDGIAVTVEYPDGVAAALAASGGERAVRALRGADLMGQAVGLRDGQVDLGGAADVWRAAVEHCSDGADGLYSPEELMSAAAAALVMAAGQALPVADADLGHAVAFLLERAAVVATWAPPPRDASQQQQDQPNVRRPVREMAWHFGEDRSLATALPVLLHDPGLFPRAGVTGDDVAAAIQQVVASPFDECRRRLVEALKPLWASPCDAAGLPHAVLLPVARRLLSNAGYGELGRSGLGYPAAALPEPLEGVLAGAEEPVLELGSAAFAVDLLTAGEHLPCEHGRAAAALLDVIVDYDTAVWPGLYARQRYGRTATWREAVDRLIATRVLRGDNQLLARRLDAFAAVGEQLTGLLVALTEQATDQQRAEQLHGVWPVVLDRLLPQSRSLTAIGDRGKPPYYRDVDDLDDALLLVPPANAVDWPWQRTADLGARWQAAFVGRPDHADRFIIFAGRLFGLGTERGATLVLSVLGQDVTAMRRESRYVVAFLGMVLRAPAAGSAVGLARVLLDRLAADGHEAALQLQQELELGPWSPTR